MASIRTFVAIALSQELKDALHDLQLKLKSAARVENTRWIPSDSLHLTVKFIGNIESDRVPAFAKALHSAVRSVAPFILNAQGLGCFPNAGRPNVIWVGLEGEVESLRRLARQVEYACASLGVMRENRPLSPHLTIGRVKPEASGPDRKELGLAVANVAPERYGSITVDSIQLIRSVLRSGGSIYTVLETIPLGNRPDASRIDRARLTPN